MTDKKRSSSKKMKDLENEKLEIANELGIPCCDFNKTEFLKELKSRKNNFLVFGSFMLVGEFLKDFNGFKKK